jgi:1,4-alpha-glucan branching enzyme/maltooligosyltrehalose trehalohydrolase
VLDFYRILLDIRHRDIVPLLKGIGGKTGRFRSEGSAIAVDWTLAGGAQLHLLANLSQEPASVGAQAAGAENIFSLGGVSGDSLAPWSVIWSISRA